MNYSSDGRTADASTRDYYLNGIKGEKGVTVVFDSKFFDETMISFYAPIHYEDEVVGVIRGTYLAEEYLKNMLSTTYFGEAADVYLCMPDGRMIASSNGKAYEGDLLDLLLSSGVIDADTAAGARAIFENGGEGSFICSSDSKTDNICVMYLPESQYVLVQVFPKNVTQSMINAGNRVGMQLETMLIGMFVIYIIILLIRAGRKGNCWNRKTGKWVILSAASILCSTALSWWILKRIPTSIWREQNRKALDWKFRAGMKILQNIFAPYW